MNEINILFISFLRGIYIYRSGFLLCFQ